tara:strand:- start:321 stop:848 length:528 start_codon:yes stop_codon:yes gene_type:complete
MFLDSGATSVRVAQNVMGGDQAGEINIACTWDSLDLALRAPGDLRKNPEMIATMQASGVQTLRRSLMLVDAERGVQEGEFLSMLVTSADQADPATMEANADAFWTHMESGANGIMWCRGLAAGPLNGLYIALTASDSADALMAASAAMFADASVQQMMAEQNAQMVGRAMMRVIG